MTQEGVILGLTVDMQKSQLAEAQTNLTSLQQSKLNAQKRSDTYQGYLDAGYLPEEDAQIALVTTAVVLNTLSAVFNTFSVPLSLLPAVTAGLFSFGVTEEEEEKAAQGVAMALQSAAGAASGIADILGITAQHHRSVQDWTLQQQLAAIDMAQIDAQIAGAQYQIQAAQQQIAMTQKQVEQNKAISDFYRSKFTNQELYEWMAGRLSDLHYQTYQLTLDMARAAERAFQFERGQSETKTTYIQGQAVGQPAQRTPLGLHTGGRARTGWNRLSSPQTPAVSKSLRVFRCCKWTRWRSSSSKPKTLASSISPKRFSTTISPAIIAGK